ncbi:MAG: DUF2231 domain-containing protein [Phycisphaerae bacterium]
MSKPESPLKSALLGRWLGHPLHPALVHLPIALWLTSLLFDVLADCNVGGTPLVRAAFWAIALGLLSTLLVVPTGIAEWTEIKPQKPAWKLALWHMLLNVGVTLLMLASLILRWVTPLADHPPLAALLLNIAGNVILLFSGYLGGRMVYEHGIAVARLSKKEWRHIAAQGNANLPPPQ